MPYRAVTHDGVTLLCFPPYDDVFTRIAMARLAELPEVGPRQLQVALRDEYPRVTVRKRNPLAALRPGEAWYVYRDGRYSPYANDAWWERTDAASIELDSDGVFRRANRAGLRLLGVKDGAIPGNIDEVTNPLVNGHVPWSLELAKETGVLHSMAVIRPLDGTDQVALEYRLSRQEDATWRVAIRPIPLEDALPADRVRSPAG